MIDVERPEWMADGLCSTGDQALVDMFFPTRGQSVRTPKEICRSCPVRDECLEYAITENIQHGIWGGMSKRERRAERRRRRDEGTLQQVERPIVYGDYRSYSRCLARPEGACRECLDANNRYQQRIRPSRATAS